MAIVNKVYKLIKYLCYVNLWIAFAAALQYFSWHGFQTTWKLSLQCLFVFFSTVCLYNAQRIWFKPYKESAEIDKRVEWVVTNNRRLKVWALLSLFFSVLLVFSFELKQLPVLPVLAFLSIGYSYLPYFNSGLRSLGFFKAAIVAMVWTGVCLLLGERFYDIFSFQTLYFFLIMYALCLLFDYRDRKRDKMKTPANVLSINWFTAMLMVLVVLTILVQFIAFENFAFSSITFLLLTLLVVFNKKVKNHALFYSLIVDGFLVIEVLLRYIFID